MHWQVLLGLALSTSCCGQVYTGNSNRYPDNRTSFNLLMLLEPSAIASYPTSIWVDAGSRDQQNKYGVSVRALDSKKIVN